MTTAPLRWLSLLAPSIAFAAMVTGCSAQPSSKVASDMKTMKEERSPELLFERGKAFHNVGDLTRAEQYYAAALQAGAAEKQVLPLLLRVCVDSGRYRVGIEYAEPFLAKHPDDWRLRLVLASLYHAIGQSESARTHLQVVLAANPDVSTAHYALAVLLRDEFHDRVGADEHFREYLRIEPEGPHADEARGSLLKSVP
jgi:tetratricopeptide (TPR) repeat protein